MGKVTKDARAMERLARMGVSAPASVGARIEAAGRVLRDADRAGRPSLDAAGTLAASRFDGMRSGAALDKDPDWFEGGARSRLGWRRTDLAWRRSRPVRLPSATGRHPPL